MTLMPERRSRRAASAARHIAAADPLIDREGRGADADSSFGTRLKRLWIVGFLRAGADPSTCRIPRGSGASSLRAVPRASATGVAAGSTAALEPARCVRLAGRHERLQPSRDCRSPGSSRGLVQFGLAQRGLEALDCRSTWAPMSPGAPDRSSSSRASSRRESAAAPSASAEPQRS